MKTKILFVDENSSLNSSILNILKSKYDFTIITNPNEGINLIKNGEDFGIILSDYRIPEMNGIEFLTKAKLLLPDTVRMIITNSDDINIAIKAVNETNIFRFLTKPFDYDLLLSSLEEAAELNRIIVSEKELTKKLQEAYETIKQDLQSAAKLQRSLLPKKNVNIQGVEFNSVFNPSVFVSGDIFNYFLLDDTHIGFYLIDVSGHGFSSAMFSVALSSYITPDIQKDSPLKTYSLTNNNYKVLSPKEVIAKLNQRFLTTGKSIEYFTMVYGIIDLTEETLTICHAGHPPSFLMNGNGNVTKIHSPNYPVAVLGEIDFQEVKYNFPRGTKVLIYSDGLTECRNKNRENFSDKKIMKILSESNGMSPKKILSKLSQELYHWRGQNDFDDDVTFFMIERT